MTELDREMILHDRAEARDNFKMRVKAGLRHKQMQVKTSQPRERDVGPPSSRMRSSVREPREAPRTAKDNALNELVARRMKTQDPDYQRKNRDATASAARERERQVSMRSSRKRSYSDSDSESDDDEESSREGDRSDREGSDDDDRKEEPEAGVDDIKSITIRRSKLAKWFMEPFLKKLSWAALSGLELAFPIPGRVFTEFVR